jgi:predicted AAA+ superfamily ATPase
MDLSTISEKDIIERLRFENPWWKDQLIPEFYGRLPEREYFKSFLPIVQNTKVRRAVVLMGPRRVGKTVMLFQAISKLIEDNINPRKICYINVENPYFLNLPLERLFALSRKASGEEDQSGWFVFFDEIQYLKDWEVHLKSLVDSYHATKFIASGSAAAALKLKSNESGAGRFTDFMLPPLTFYEYIHIKGLQNIIPLKENTLDIGEINDIETVDIKSLNKHFIDYINFGGYPEVVFSEELKKDPGRYIRSDIIDKVLLRDLPSLYGIENVQELNKFFSTIAYNSGNEFSFEAMTKLSGVDKITIRRYLTFLEAAYLIKIVHRVDMNLKRFKRENFFKIYLTNAAMRSALFSPIVAEDDAMGNMTETAIFSQWLMEESFMHYARWKDGEVDMVILDSNELNPYWSIEIKWSNRYFENPGELKSMLNFLDANKFNEAIITTIDKTGIKEINGKKLSFIPASLVCYFLGKMTVDMDYFKKTIIDVFVDIFGPAFARLANKAKNDPNKDVEK